MIQATKGRTSTVWTSRIVLAAVLALGACLVPMAEAAESAKTASAVQSAADAQTSNNAQSMNGTAVLEAFDQQQVQRVKQSSELNDHNKRIIMFALAVPLFVLLLITGGLGIATGVYGKKLFIPHMIFAGLTVTLALAHAIVGVVWFYPF
ncbi:MAG TPA: hypothetical protein VIU46_01540 [Gallionellaceae bacterium]